MTTAFVVMSKVAPELIESAAKVEWRRRLQNGVCHCLAREVAFAGDRAGEREHVAGVGNGHMQIGKEFNWRGNGMAAG